MFQINFSVFLQVRFCMKNESWEPLVTILLPLCLFALCGCWWRAFKVYSAPGKTPLRRPTFYGWLPAQELPLPICPLQTLQGSPCAGAPGAFLACKRAGDRWLSPTVQTKEGRGVRSEWVGVCGSPGWMLLFFSGNESVCVGVTWWVIEAFISADGWVGVWVFVCV